jgi:hypothetical protein
MTKIEEDFGCVEGWMFQQLISCEINWSFCALGTVYMRESHGILILSPQAASGKARIVRSDFETIQCLYFECLSIFNRDRIACREGTWLNGRGWEPAGEAREDEATHLGFQRLGYWLNINYVLIGLKFSTRLWRWGIWGGASYTRGRTQPKYLASEYRFSIDFRQSVTPESLPSHLFMGAAVLILYRFLHFILRSIN